MLNDRDDKYDNHEESEYHFSDEEVNYEVEPETPKLAAQSKENFFNRLGRSKRMVISVIVFLILVFVVYKMVAPTSTTIPNTDISPASPQASNNTVVSAPMMQPETQPAAAIPVSNVASPDNLGASANNAATANSNIPTTMPVASPISQQPMPQQAMMPSDAQAPNTYGNAQSPVIVVPENTPAPAAYNQGQMMPSQIPQQVAQSAASTMPSAVPQMM